MVIFSDSTKQVSMWELTVPWQKHMAHERKLARYQKLVEQYKSQDQWVFCELTEVG